MICNKCGTDMQGTPWYCPCCGAATGFRSKTPIAGGNTVPYGYPEQQQPYQQYQQPYQQPMYGQAQNPQFYAQPMPVQPAPQSYSGKYPDYTFTKTGRKVGMAWFKFILYFQLFFSAISAVWYGIMMISGLQYSHDASLVYHVFPSMKTWDTVIGIVFLLMAGFAIYTRMELSHFKRIGPMLYYSYCGVGVLAPTIYVLACIKTVMDAVGYQVSFNYTRMIISIVVSVLMLGINIYYFQNRKHLFVR